ncbi:MAG: hypothetical protein A4E67_00953 [Syntrophaceae bacterium PtaB.Bin038]|nr:MAG: hypothetical protein A4E67_00953 [Syntrophaceae bacterium PtaB.Bin038]
MAYVLLAPLVTVDVPWGEIVPPEPAEAVMVKDPAAAAWVTVKACPATERVAVLEAVPVLAATLKDTDPCPAPLDPAVTASHAALLDAVQPHVEAVETVTLPVPPEEG